jgi:hypothetical protein
MTLFRGDPAERSPREDEAQTSREFGHIVWAALMLVLLVLWAVAKPS